MERLDCEIVRDLLPLYHDGVCSPKSRETVAEHLESCEDCQSALAELDAPLPEEARFAAAQDVETVKKIAREWNRSRWKARLRGAAIAAAVCAVMFGGWLAATEGFWFPVDTDKIQLTDVRQLSDGRVLYHLYIDDDLTLRALQFEYDDAGNKYYVPKRALYTEKRQGPSLADSDQIMDIAEVNAWARAQGIDREITRVWYGRGEDAILLWEEGMELPAASAGDEAAYGYEPGSAEYWAERQADT